MSSTYRVLCLSHDPAIYVDGAEWQTRHEMEHALATVSAAPALAEHRTCDLLGGRYSYPLIEVYCPPARDDIARHSPWHPRSGEWVDADWLRLLWVAMTAPANEHLEAAIRRIPGCWTWERLDRLAGELGVTS